LRQLRSSAAGLPPRALPVSWATTSAYPGARKAAFSLLLFAPIAASAWAQPIDRLHDPVDNYSLQANSFIDALLWVSARFQLPMGVEWVKTADTLEPAELSRAHTNAAEVIQALVSAHTGYEWAMEDGVVHVFQNALTGDVHNPLNTKLEYGLSADCRPMIAVSIEIHLEQHLRSIVEPKPQGGWGASIGSSPDEPRLYVPCRNASVRDFLDTLAAASWRPIWIATFPEKRTLTPTGFLEEEPMKPPGSEQPFWIFLRWDEAPPQRMVR
jgi:hypothetical protein